MRTDNSFVSELNNECVVEEAPKAGASSLRFKINRSILGYFLAMVSGVLFILLSSSWTSPIFPGAYGYDSAFFSMVGRAILEGKTMYRDYFDIKGPVFFFWEAFGQLLHRDRLGIFFIQCISIMGATFYLYKMCRMYALKWKKIIFVFAIFFISYEACLWGGNSVEEYCLPLTMGCLYYGLKYLKAPKADRGIEIAFFFGITFGVCLLSKVTVCAPMAAVVLVVFIQLLIEKNYAIIAKCVGLFLAGVVLVAVPVFLYYYLRNSLAHMIMCVFFTGFKRGVDYYEPISLKWEAFLIPCYVSLVTFFFRRKDKGTDKWVLLSLTVVTFIALHLGTPFEYYFITQLPLIAFLCILICQDIQRITFWLEKQKYIGESQKHNTNYVRHMMFKIVVLSASLGIICTGYVKSDIDKIKSNYDIAINKTEMEYYNDCKEIFDIIPREDWNSVFGVEAGMIVFEVNQVLPATKYPVNMPYFCELYPPAEGEILYVIEKQTPKWIIAEDLASVDNENIRTAVYDHYEKILDNSMDQLWRRID